MATNPQDKDTTTKPTADTAEANTSTKRETAGETYTITIPSMRSLGATADVVEPKHLLWFGALAVAGAAGVIEWPVVAAVGIGSFVAERFARSGNRRHQT
jgi:hypothetical protein